MPGKIAVRGGDARVCEQDFGGQLQRQGECPCGARCFRECRPDQFIVHHRMDGLAFIIRPYHRTKASAEKVGIAENASHCAFIKWRRKRDDHFRARYYSPDLLSAELAVVRVRGTGLTEGDDHLTIMVCENSEQ